MTLILITEDGRKMIFDSGNSLRMAMEYIANNPIETIVIGDIEAYNVLWEKQFKAVTVMPTTFGQEKP